MIKQIITCGSCKSKFEHYTHNNSTNKKFCEECLDKKRREYQDKTYKNHYKKKEK